MLNYISGPSRKQCPDATYASGHIWWTLRSRCQKLEQLLKRTRCFATMLSQRAILSCSWYFMFLVFILKVHLVESVWEIHITCQPKGNMENVVLPLHLVLHSCESKLGSWKGCWMNHLSVSATNGTGLKVITVLQFSVHLTIVHYYFLKNASTPRQNWDLLSQQSVKFCPFFILDLGY